MIDQNSINLSVTVLTPFGKNIEPLKALISSDAGENQKTIEIAANHNKINAQILEEDFADFYNGDTTLALTITNANGEVVYYKKEEFCLPVDHDISILVENCCYARNHQRSSLQYSLVSLPAYEKIQTVSGGILPIGQQQSVSDFINVKTSKLCVLAALASDALKGNTKALPVLNDLLALERMLHEETDIDFGEIQSSLSNSLSSAEIQASDLIPEHMPNVLNDDAVITIFAGSQLAAGDDSKISLLNYISLTNLLSEVIEIETLYTESMNAAKGDQLAEFSLINRLQINSDLPAQTTVIAPDQSFSVSEFFAEIEPYLPTAFPSPREWKIPQEWKGKIKEYEFEEFDPFDYTPGPDDAPAVPKFKPEIWDPFKKLIPPLRWDKFRQGLRYACTLELVGMEPIEPSFYNMSKISDQTLCPGEEVLITGSGFGSDHTTVEREVIMYQKSGDFSRKIYVSPSSWSDTEIAFSVPENAVSGKLSLSIVFRQVQICGKSRNFYKAGNNFPIFIPELSGSLYVSVEGKGSFGKSVELFRIKQNDSLVRNDTARISWETKDAESAKLSYAYTDSQKTIIADLSGDSLNKKDSVLWPASDLKLKDTTYTISLEAVSIKGCEREVWKATIDMFYGIKPYVESFLANSKSESLIVKYQEPVELSWSILDANKYK
ncbi:MAG: hypothetical protein AAFN38_20950, partial [Cyanobacteria bacterium J06560_5]